MTSSILICALLLMGTWVTAFSKKGFAETTDVSTKTITDGEQTINLSNSFSLHINNQSQGANYQFSQSGKTVDEETLSLARVEVVQEWTAGNSEYVLVEEREDGSGAYLNFRLFQISDTSIKEIFHSDKLYPKASVSVEGDTIKVTYPVYGNNQPRSEPTAIQADEYQLDQDKLSYITTESAVDPAKPARLMRAKAFYQNPSWNEISDYLTQKAIEHNIPPEIVKAIAWQESGWRQFTTSGDPVIGFDGRGLGMMQITLSQSVLDSQPGLENQLKYDWKANVDYGLNILDEKWGYGGKANLTPTINDNDKKNIVNWYFAIMAYNGFSKVNDPNLSPYTPYQDLIYAHMKNYGLLDVPEVAKSDLNVYYVSGSSRMYFNNKMNYTINSVINTKYLFKTGQQLQVTTSNVNLRSDHEVTAPVLKTLNSGDQVTVTGAPVNPNDPLNQFTFYPVKTADGTVGYIASSYLSDQIDHSVTTPIPTPEQESTSGDNSAVDSGADKGTVNNEKTSFFTDFKSGDQGYNEVAALAKKGIIKGHANGTFGPKEALTRLQAAFIFVEALNLPTPAVQSTGFKDVKASVENANIIAAVKKAGIFSGDDKGNFNANQTLTRGQMAKVLCEAYHLQHKSSYSSPFADAKSSSFKDYIETLYANGITNGVTRTTFGVNQAMSRVNFSVFVYRVLEKKGLL
ncbi:hypothetical protein JOD43_002073 [Pullulanibacillus pueri]|nr:hypothetical protein [Pullulanibacillus pueri]